jgi:hypothetical protein
LHVSLKDQLILTMNETYAAAVYTVKEKKTQAKKPGKGRKCKAQEVESELEDNSSQLDSDPVLLLEILKCMKV